MMQHGTYALHYASIKVLPTIAKILIEAGAKVSVGGRQFCVPHTAAPGQDKLDQDLKQLGMLVLS